eukprot:TRINITY_DN11597_c0_g1_i1.p1 TRINITY_DN11597_c0_g1~~TRINITY_DN11597_c0_g1_i1.p1  ORF type:complete len:728 (-),score=186.19 TRINITY_DN11597_c0_g1_i1:37-2220(-)
MLVILLMLLGEVILKQHIKEMSISSKILPINTILSVKLSQNIEVKWEETDQEEISLVLESSFTGNNDIEVASQFTAASNPSLLVSDEVLSIVSGHASDIANATGNREIIGYLTDIDWKFKLRTFFEGYQLSLADVVLFTALGSNSTWVDIFGGNKKKKYKYLARWYSYLSSLPSFQYALSVIENNVVDEETEQTGSAVFSELEGAKQGEVVVRFPPEPSGYLHLGHGKAAFINDYFRNEYQGQLILRFDDTNPRKEKEEFEEAIEHDLNTMGIIPDRMSHTSDYFDIILAKAEEMISIGKAYMDDTPAEEMSRQREAKENCKYRDNTVEENFEMWEQFKSYTEEGKKMVLRAKIDMQSNNGTMRDPVIYRYVGKPHNRTGDQYLIYPIYNFACPIVDSLEGVTHACRSNEYHSSETQYYWFLENIPGCRPVKIQDFSRLNVKGTILSKRNLQWFVDNGHAEGWDDPRFPTIQGAARRGLEFAALKQFIMDLGNSTNAVNMDINKLWAFNKQLIDPIVPRYNVVFNDSVLAKLLDVDTTEVADVDLIRNKPEVGQKVVYRTSEILIDQVDVKSFKDGEEFTLMNWGNAILQKQTVNKEGNFTEIELVTNIGGDFKKTKKITWVPATDEAVPVRLMYYGSLLTVPNLPKPKKNSKGEVIKPVLIEDYANLDSVHPMEGTAEPAVASVNVGDSIQFQRRGYFKLDKIEEDGTRVFINIPDGHETDVWKFN